MRSKILSTKKVKLYKLITLLIWLILFVFLTVLLIISFKVLNLYWLVYWGFAFYMFYWKRVRHLKNIEYDHANLYIVENGQEIEIPFYEVKHIKLRSVLGTHSITLFNNLGFGKEIFFKSSLWYPFNFKSIDNEVYELRKRIDSSHRQIRASTGHGLPSQTV